MVSGDKSEHREARGRKGSDEYQQHPHIVVLRGTLNLRLAEIINGEGTQPREQQPVRLGAEATIWGDFGSETLLPQSST